MKKTQLRKIGKIICEKLGREKLDILAKETGFVKRESKLGGAEFVLLNINGDGHQGFGSLTELCVKLKDQFGVCITKQALNQRFNPHSVEFLKQVYNSILLEKLPEDSKIESKVGIKKIFIRDATSTQLPEVLLENFKGSGGSSSKAGIKIDLLHDSLNGNSILEIKDGSAPDTKAKLNDIEESCLYLMDLGYWKLSTFKKIEEEKAYYVSRYKQPTNIYLTKDDKEQVTISSLAKGLKVDQTISIIVYVGNQQRFKTRMVIQKLPRSVAQERRKKIEDKGKQKGHTVKEERKENCKYTIMMTNLSESEVSDLKILEYYKLRWQIELMFKCWKSVFKFGEVHPMKYPRFMCMLYGHLIWILLTMKITSIVKKICWNSYGFEISEMKMFKIIYVKSCAQILKPDKKHEMDKQLNEIFELAFYYAEKEVKKSDSKLIFLTNAA